MSEQFSFPSAEKLKSRKTIGQIFSEGFAVKSYPVRIQFIFHSIDHCPAAQVGVSVPKRSFKKAVDRNRIKRQLREIYRLHKKEFIKKLERKNVKIAMMIIYTGKVKPDFESLTTSTLKAMAKIRF
ncbi:MAG: ribonuclease P protein component [Saprospiraceae bacterium]|nr:ribonuclease P protein component [Saprospiraceae bacterium]